MDSKFFRLPTKPNFVGPVQHAAPVDIREFSQRQEFPAPDSRYKGWPGPMSDARVVTDYAPHCQSNIPAGSQFPTKVWMQKHGDEILQFSRKQTGLRMGSFLPYDNSVVPPAAMKVVCKPGECMRIVTNAPGGIGMEREGTPCPELFGTFERDTTGAPRQGRPQYLTTRFEGGRNSPRG
jgi:hypothetical protein